MQEKENLVERAKQKANKGSTIQLSKGEPQLNNISTLKQPTILTQIIVLSLLLWITFISYISFKYTQDLVGWAIGSMFLGILPSLLIFNLTCWKFEYCSHLKYNLRQRRSGVRKMMAIWLVGSFVIVLQNTVLFGYIGQPYIEKLLIPLPYMKYLENRLSYLAILFVFYEFLNGVSQVLFHNVLMDYVFNKSPYMRFMSTVIHIVGLWHIFTLITGDNDQPARAIFSGFFGFVYFVRFFFYDKHRYWKSVGLTMMVNGGLGYTFVIMAWMDLNWTIPSLIVYNKGTNIFNSHNLF